jgi:anti-sigma regulatory factor (Ser/Thr protein kinase)
VVVARRALQVELDSAADITVSRGRLRAWLANDLSPDGVDDVLLAVGEAIDNALEHGMPPISVRMSWQAERELVVEVHDAGRWTIVDDASQRGYGMPIMTKLMDAVSVDTTRGTRLVLRRRFHPAPAAERKSHC